MGISVFHKLFSPNEGGDCGRIPNDPCRQLIPFLRVPEILPLLWGDRKWDRSAIGFNLLNGVEEAKVSQVWITTEAFSVNAHQISIGVVIDHGLVAAAILGGA